MKRLSLLVLLVACTHASLPPEPPSASSSPTATPLPVKAAAPAPAVSADLTAQIERGKQLYVAKCAKCHGNAGEGTKDGPAVVGKDAFPLDPRPGQKRTMKFHTAADVFTFATNTMPADDPESLTSDELLAIFAFDLTANGVQLTKPLDATQAQAIVLHP